MEQVHADKLFDYIVGGEAKVVNAVFLLELYKHLLIVGEGSIVDLYAGLIFKAGDEFFVDIIAPVEDVQRYGICALCAAGEEAYSHDDHQQKGYLFHLLYYLLYLKSVVGIITA